ncbi:Nucleoside phosphatase [Ceraceosorus bombacis]|uniref:Nucleoside phosphatase n=1 Tax=Ceraceosorus bombacis TaxID=401625 RepID=A0A0P1BFG7_9BASI|nr:Nucleoside phosphatase [Ceraceosorus bombacis]
MQVYSWKDAIVDKATRASDGLPVKVLPNVQKGTWEGSGMEWQKKVEPGLSSFATHPQDLSLYLRPLLDQAERIVPPSSLSETPIYVLATAGMRLLSPSQRTSVLRETCRVIQTQSRFKVDRIGNCEEQVQVISGEEEGLLGWIAINYLMDGFHFKEEERKRPDLIDHAAVTSNRTRTQSTFGFLDLGGASTQIAFQPADPAAEEDLTRVTLRMLDGTDVQSDVFVTTFLGYGTNRARERYVEALALAAHNATANKTDERQKQVAAIAASASSLPSSTKSNTSSTSNAAQNLGAAAASAAVSNSTSPVVTDPCLPSGLSLQTQTNETLLGTGSFETCLASLEPLLDKSAACSRPPCLFHGVHVPPISFATNHFVGVSEYWFSSNDVFGLGGVYDFVSFQKAASDFCQRPWSDLSSTFEGHKTWGPQVDLGRLQMQCFKAAWMTTVLHDGIGLPRILDAGGDGDGKPHSDQAMDKADEKNLFQSVNDVKGLAVSWTLGKAVLEASRDIPPAIVTGFPAKAPIVSNPGSSSWADKWRPTWHRPGDPLAPPLPSLRAGKHRISGVLVLLFVLGTLMLCLFGYFFKGRSPRAIKRRNAFKDALPPPLGSCLGMFRMRSGAGGNGRGEYVLAEMDEGDVEAATGQEYGGAGGTSSSEENDPKGASLASKAERRRLHRNEAARGGVSTFGLLRLLAYPFRAVFLGRNAARGVAERNKRRNDADHAAAAAARRALRRQTSTLSLGMSTRAHSPAIPVTGGFNGTSSPVISRPASRANARSPRTVGAGANSTAHGVTPISSPQPFGSSAGYFGNAWISNGVAFGSGGNSAAPLLNPNNQTSSEWRPAKTTLSRNSSGTNLNGMHHALTPRSSTVAGAFARRVSASNGNAPAHGFYAVGTSQHATLPHSFLHRAASGNNLIGGAGTGAGREQDIREHRGDLSLD